MARTLAAALATSLRRRIVQSPLHRPVIELRAALDTIRVERVAAARVSTVYCISPYKTGTTYLAGLFRGIRTAHEPMQLATLRRLEDAEFLRRRATLLNLQLESSGFFAGRLPTLREVAPEARVVMIFRPFWPWIESFLSYFEGLDRLVRFNYIPRLVFDGIVGLPVERYASLPPAARAQVVRRLFSYWSASYVQGLRDEATLVVPLTSIDAHVDHVARFLGFENAGIRADAWRRTATDKRRLAVSDLPDAASIGADADVLEAQVLARLAEASLP